MTEPTYFQDRLSHLGSRKEEIDSKLVSYVPVDGTPIDWQASLGRVSVSEVINEAIVNEYQTRDYIGSYAVLGNREPLEGDKILDGALVCEVMPLLGKTYLFTTERRDRIRIHTKVVAE